MIDSEIVQSAKYVNFKAFRAGWDCDDSYYHLKRRPYLYPARMYHHKRILRQDTIIPLNISRFYRINNKY